MKYSVLVLVTATLFSSITNVNASSFEERASFMDKNKPIATTIGIMKFCHNKGLESSLMQKAASSILVDAVMSRPKKQVDDSEELIQALDFHAVGVAMGLKISAMSKPAQENICSLGVKLADQLLTPQR